MANTGPSEADNDFAFIVGSLRYECPWFVAAFLSPRIGRLRQRDRIVTEYKVETEDPKHQFEAFPSLGRGSLVAVESEPSISGFSLV
jgi:hypothetical protein